MPRIDLEAVNGSIVLAGSLWTPDDQQPAALILMYPGSGPSDRDNDVFFPAIREAFIAAGVAVTSFDKRGVGGSGGSWLTAGIEHQALDLLAFLDRARKRLPEVPIGLFGHSQGGWVVLEAVAMASPDFVITSSGPSVTPRAQEEFSARAGLNHDAEALLATLSGLFDRLSAGQTWDEASEWMSEPARAAHFAALQSVGAFVPDGPELLRYAALILDHDPSAALEALSIPLLAVLGSLDNVVPVEASAAAFRGTVRPDLLTLRVIEGGDHRIQHPDTGELAAGYLAALVEFVRSVLLALDSGNPHDSHPPQNLFAKKPLH